MSSSPFPFSAVVGQEEAQRALLLAAIDPAIGGVLLRGEKGSAKSTLARGLAALLPADAPFVELPVGATEDRVLGSLDVRALVAGVDGEGSGDRADPASAFRPGLLAAAHGGVLYVDEVNLLPDQIVDGLLDAAASGVNRVERDGVSYEHPARFVLLGSMNPEEGELRPQLLDRFGLAVEVRSPVDPTVRAEAVRRRLAHDARQDEELTQNTVRNMAEADDELRQRLVSARPATLPDQVLALASTLAVAVGAESLRADLVLCRAAAALAGWEGRDAATEDDVERVAALALGHRRRRRPFEPPTLPSDELQSALKAARDAIQGELDDEPPAEDLHPDDDQDRGPDDGRGGSGQHDHHDPDTGSRTGNQGPLAGPPDADTEHAADRRGPDDGEGRNGGGTSRGPTDPPGSRWEKLAGSALQEAPVPLGFPPDGRRPQSGPKVTGDGTGRVAGHSVPGLDGPRGVAVVPTIRAMVERRTADPDGPALHHNDIREPRRLQRDQRTIVLLLDTSGSMGTAARVGAATGAVLALLADAYLTRDQIALVAFRDDAALEVLPPTASVELARARLADLPTGGSTPLAEGLAAGLATAQRAMAKESSPLLVVLTDGRATGTPGALDRARSAARAVADAGVDAVVLDAEDGDRHQRLGLAPELATLMNGRCLHLSAVTATEVESAVRASLP